MPEIEKKEYAKDCSQERGLTRRSFLKTSAFLAGATATVGSFGCSSLSTNASPITGEEEVYVSSCRSPCYGGCRLKVHVRDGKICGFSAAEQENPDYTGICARGVSNLTNTYSPKRLAHPLKRVGERGGDEWERITWDEAIETITSKWKEHRAEFGEHSVIMGGGGLLTKVSALMNASSFGVLLDMAQMMWSGQVLGYGLHHSGNETADFLNARCILVWGSNPSDAQIQQYKFILGAQQKGAKIVAIDPNCTVTTSKADVHVPVRPGTDAALAFAMMNVVMREGWEDKEFLAKSTVAPFLVKESDSKFLRLSDLGVEPTQGPVDPRTGQPSVVDPFVVWDSESNSHKPLGEVTEVAINGSFTIDGIRVTTAFDLLLDEIEKYPPEKAAEICDISAELIEQVAEIYVKNSPSSIYSMFGIDRYTNGHYSYWAMMCLAAITGNVGKSGATAGLSCGNSPFFSFMGASMATKPTNPGPRIASQVFPEVMETGMFGEIPVTPKSIYFKSGGFHSSPDRKRIVEAMKKLDFIAVEEIWMTSTARYADIVLPGAYWYETEHTYCCFTPYVNYMPQIIEPLNETKTAHQIAQLLAKGMGYTKESEETPEEILRENLSIDGAPYGITYEKLKEKGQMRIAPMGSNGTYVYGEGGVFGTPSGRIEFYLENPQPTGYWGQTIDYSKEHLPRFEPPSEAWYENPLIEKYPLQSFQEHAKWRVHTQFSRAPWLREIDPEPIIKLNSQDAEARGIKTGDTVKAFNDRGYVVLKAVINNGLRPGVSNIQHGWEWEQFIDGHYQDITPNTYHPMCVNAVYVDNLIEVEKVEEV